MNAIEASSVGVKTMADGTLRLSVDIEPMHAQAAFALFGKPGQPLALAALKPASSAPAPETAKGGTLAQWVAMRCQEFDFQTWLASEFGPNWAHLEGATAEETAVNVVRYVCGIRSRAELDNDPAAADRFHRLIRKPYSEAA